MIPLDHPLKSELSQRPSKLLMLEKKPSKSWTSTDRGFTSDWIYSGNVAGNPEIKHGENPMGFRWRFSRLNQSNEKMLQHGGLHQEMGYEMDYEMDYEMG